jgi:hypothetical protein
MVAIHLDANYIFVKPMRNRTKEEMIGAYEKIINRMMRRAGLGIRKHTLDNEALDAFKQYIHQQEIQFELVPPGSHRRNQAERAIQTFKSHFISILAGVNDKFPLSLWCHLLEPTELTLNLLCQSKVAPKVSAFSHVHGHHAYMKKPFAPLGCAIEAHVKPDDRRTWDTRLDSGFSLVHRCNITTVFACTLQRLEQQGLATQFISSTSTSPTRQSHLNLTSLRQPNNLQ